MECGVSVAPTNCYPPCRHQTPEYNDVGLRLESTVEHYTLDPLNTSQPKLKVTF